MTLVLDSSPNTELDAVELPLRWSKPPGAEQSSVGTGAPVSPVASLVLKAREGDSSAWGELVIRFGSMIAAIGRRYRLSAPECGRASADDLASVGGEPEPY